MTSAALDDAIAEARARDIAEVVQALELPLRAVSGWMTGPCPQCGGTDRFNVNLRDGGFFCRKGCAAKGCGPIDLVMTALGLEFRGAVEWLAGPVRAIDPKERRRRAAARARAREEVQAEEARRRAAAIDAARDIWQAAGRTAADPVWGYLTRRGITRDRLGALPRCLRYMPDHPYRVMRTLDGRRTWPELHRGPCMVAAIQAPDGRLSCVHQTWFDLSGPLCKPDIRFQGERQRNKLTRGSQRRAAIRLVTPERFDTLVMGEGIETTLTCAIAWGQALPGAAFWAGISLGHMGGKMTAPGLPDMDDPRAFVPPPWVTRLIYVQDGDSDPEKTRAKLLAGLRRARRLAPDCRGQIVAAPRGMDMNDLLMKDVE